MTDLQTMLIMFAKSKEDFSKQNLNHGFQIRIPGRKIIIWFKKDESFDFMTTE